MREEVLQYIRERKLLKAGDRVAVAVSGGADSVALLRVLLELREELGIILVVAHFNHQLRGEDSDADERFVGELAGHLDLPFFVGRADVRERAAVHKLSLEHAARDLRYGWLAGLAQSEKLGAIATAHTADDQAETVLMKFLRGAGTRGLASIHPVLVMDGFVIIRPLLATTRADVERYLAELQQVWRDDHTNLDMQYRRNRIRHELLPLLEREYNPNLRRVLRETAEVARAEEEVWLPEVIRELSQRQTELHSLQVNGFKEVPIGLQRRLLKAFIEREGFPPEFHRVEDLRSCALGEAPVANLPNGWLATREGEWLRLKPPQVEGFAAGFEYPLAVPGEQPIPETGLMVRVTIIPAEVAKFEIPGTLLCANGLRALTLRNWRSGDRFRAAHSGSEEKLKRLFSEKRIPTEQRRLWPVALTADGRIAWVRGFPIAHDFAWTPGSGDAVKIEVLPINPVKAAT